MGEDEATEVSPEMGEENEEEIRRQLEERDALRRQLDSRPMPDSMQAYDVRESALWEKRYLPVGSIIVFDQRDEETGTQYGDVALMITDTDTNKDGFMLRTKLVGAVDPGQRARLQKVQRSGPIKVHICMLKYEVCPIQHEDAIHLEVFRWFPIGQFSEKWVTATGKKVIKEGMALAGKAKDPKEGKRPPALRRGMTTEERLQALKDKASPRVSFPGLEAAAKSGAGRRRARSQAGTPLALANSSFAAGDAMIPVKNEPIQVESDGEKKSKKAETSKRANITLTLAKAAQDRARGSEKKKKKERSRSRSRRGRKKRKKRKKSSGDDSSSSSSSESESSKDLMPPLKRRSQKEPGSVLRMLEAQASEHLARDGIWDDLEDDAPGERMKGLIYTYYQIILKPHLGPRSRDIRELAVLAKSLDLLRSGQLAELGDMLSARLAAVETSTKQGWGAAKYLEIHTGEEEGPVPPHILLAAQRHGRQVERAGGKGSWSGGGRQGGWSQDWRSDGFGRGRGKGKGKNPKGKGKGKGGKNTWNSDYNKEGQEANNAKKGDS